MHYFSNDVYYNESLLKPEKSKGVKGRTSTDGLGLNLRGWELSLNQATMVILLKILPLL